MMEGRKEDYHHGVPLIPPGITTQNRKAALVVHVYILAIPDHVLEIDFVGGEGGYSLQRFRRIRPYQSKHVNSLFQIRKGKG